MNNNIIDTVYLALELTKAEVSYHKPEDIVALYKTILRDLLEIKQLPDVTALQMENAELKSRLIDMRYDGLSSEKVEELIDLIEKNAGDMEPRVYNQLLDFIHLWYTV